MIPSPHPPSAPSSSTLLHSPRKRNENNLRIDTQLTENALTEFNTLHSRDSPVEKVEKALRNKNGGRSLFEIALLRNASSFDRSKIDKSRNADELHSDALSRPGSEGIMERNRGRRSAEGDIEKSLSPSGSVLTELRSMVLSRSSNSGDKKRKKRKKKKENTVALEGYHAKALLPNGSILTNPHSTEFSQSNDINNVRMSSFSPSGSEYFSTGESMSRENEAALRGNRNLVSNSSFVSMDSQGTFRTKEKKKKKKVTNRIHSDLTSTTSRNTYSPSNISKRSKKTKKSKKSKIELVNIEVDKINGLEHERLLQKHSAFLELLSEMNDDSFSKFLMQYQEEVDQYEDPLVKLARSAISASNNAKVLRIQQNNKQLKLEQEARAAEKRQLMANVRKTETEEIRAQVRAEHALKLRLIEEKESQKELAIRLHRAQVELEGLERVITRDFYPNQGVDNAMAEGTEILPYTSTGFDNFDDDDIEELRLLLKEKYATSPQGIHQYSYADDRQSSDDDGMSDDSDFIVDLSQPLSFEITEDVGGQDKPNQGEAGHEESQRRATNCDKDDNSDLTIANNGNDMTREYEAPGVDNVEILHSKRNDGNAEFTQAEKDSHSENERCEVRSTDSSVLHNKEVPLIMSGDQKREGVITEEQAVTCPAELT